MLSFKMPLMLYINGAVMLFHSPQSYTDSGASPYDSLSPMDDVTALPSPSNGVNSVAQVSSSAAEAGMLQAPVSTAL